MKNWVLILCLIGLLGKLPGQAGKLDTSFGQFGFGVARFDEDLSLQQKILLLKNGKILAGGSDFETVGISIIRCKPDGYLDPAFGNWRPGVSNLGDDFSTTFMMLDMALFSDESILCGGKYTSNGMLCKFTSDGIPDSTFGNQAIVNLPNLREISSIKIQKNDKIIALGQDRNGRPILLKLLPNGDLDSSFVTNGVLQLNEGYIGTIEITDDWKILVAGMSGRMISVKRIQSNGLIDSSFAINGEFNHDLLTNHYGRKLLLQNDKKILFLVVGSPKLIRLDSNGVLDSTFGKDGILNLAKNPERVNPYDMAIQEDHKILITGTIEIPGDTAIDFWLERYHPDGSLDLSFGDSGYVSTRFYQYAIGRSLAVQKDGKILLGGTSDSYESTTIPNIPDNFYIVRYLSGLNLGMLDYGEKIVEHQIFPNPIETSATLTFSLSQSENLSIDLFDLHGRKIKSFRDRAFFLQGKHEIELSFNDVSETGFYLLSINNGERVVSVKVLKE